MVSMFINKGKRFMHNIDKSKNVRIAAIAKDEAPYIAQWVHHHLYFGFDQIHVYVNRSEDQTVDILSKIAQKYKGVTYEIADWIDLCPDNINKGLQKICYAKDLHFCRMNNIEFLMYLDIDEFWVPADFDSKIKDHIYIDADAIAFNWHCELARPQEFSSIAPDGEYYIHRLCKTLFRTDLVINSLRVHFPEFKNASCYDADHNPLVMSDDKPQALNKDLCYSKSSFVIHRMYRSRTEYMAALLKGRAGQKGSLKNNRPGFFASGMVENELKITFNHDRHDCYLKSQNMFIDFCDVSIMIDAARDEVFAKASEVEVYIKSNPDDITVKKVSKNLFVDALD